MTRVGFSYRAPQVQQRQQVFSDLALAAFNAFTLTRRGDPEQLIGLHASAALLPTLGLQPILGRNFSADEDRAGGERVALVSHAMWQRRFNRDPSILGQALTRDLTADGHKVVATTFESAVVWDATPLKK